MPVYRTAGAWGAGKGSNLTAAESDANIHELRSDIDDLIASPPTANSIATMTVTAQSFTTTLTNGTTLGPYAITLPVFRWRDTWATGTLYEELDSFSVTGEGIFVVLHDHTSSASSFDAEAVGSSENAGSFTIGATYKIATVGTTNFTLIGASSNTVGTEFRATGVGTGTGTATRKLYRQLIGAGSNTRIEDLSDVTLLTGLVHADILVYDEDLTPPAWANWTPAQYAAELPVFVGDDASPSVGGTKGLVPAPAIGDGAAGKYLDAQGHWSVPPEPTSTLAELTDVDVTGAAANAFLVYDGTDWTDRTATQVTALLDVFVGDDASPAAGGTKGLVPAPASGDGAAGKVLTADGSWTAGQKLSEQSDATLPLDQEALFEVSEPTDASPVTYISAKITARDLFGFHRTEAPANGATIALDAKNRRLVISPAAAIATLTITLAPGVDNAAVRISTRQRIDTLTINGNGPGSVTVDWTAGELPAKGVIELLYDESLTAWVLN